MLSTVSICNSVFGILQLLFDLFSTFFSLLSSSFSLNNIWQLNDKIQFTRTRLLINNIKQCQLMNKTLKRGIWFIHYRIKWILNDRGHTLWNCNFLASTGSIIIQINSYRIWEPFSNLSDSHGFDIIAIILDRTCVQIDRNNSSDTIIHHSEDNIHYKFTTRLINVCTVFQAIIQSTGYRFLVMILFINSNVFNIDCSNINRNTIIHC